MASGLRTGSRERTRYRFPVREALLLQCPTDLDQHCHKFRMPQTAHSVIPTGGCRSGGIAARPRAAITALSGSSRTRSGQAPRQPHWLAGPRPRYGAEGDEWKAPRWKPFEIESCCKPARHFCHSRAATPCASRLLREESRSPLSPWTRQFTPACGGFQTGPPHCSRYRAT